MAPPQFPAGYGSVVPNGRTAHPQRAPTESPEAQTEVHVFVVAPKPPIKRRCDTG